MNQPYIRDLRLVKFQAFEFWEPSDRFQARVVDLGPAKAEPLELRHVLERSQSSPHQPPFTNDPATWDLTHDLGLGGGKDYDFFAALGGIRNRTGKAPLFPWRGLPPIHSTNARLMDMADDHNVGWLTLSEIKAAVAHIGFEIDQLSRPVQMVLRAMAAAEEIYGVDRVRLVFQILD